MRAIDTRYHPPIAFRSARNALSMRIMHPFFGKPIFFLKKPAGPLHHLTQTTDTHINDE
jgi:hypothetical protein